MSALTKKWMGLRNWETRDLLIVATLGIVPGLALLPVVFTGFTIRAALGPLGTILNAELFYLPGLMTLYIVRKPGASILNGVFVGLVWIPLTPFGLAVTIPTIVARIGSVIPFFLTRYRRYNRATMLVSGASAGLLSLGAIYVPSSFQILAVPVQGVLIVGHDLSGAILSGLLAKRLSDKLAETGALLAYPVVDDVDIGA
ncbi:ECF transporter S component [Haloarcula sp. CBA1127]|uniref:ECF transporter S component n=1 Tax=Haloarcula sp. CBA1127 TaxID=1765055 RepID=UPI0009ACDC85|nr:ECF transporter S component [Haloarcula sp. CBA1127]